MLEKFRAFHDLYLKQDALTKDRNSSICRRLLSLLFLYISSSFSLVLLIWLAAFVNFYNLWSHDDIVTEVQNYIILYKIWNGDWSTIFISLFLNSYNFKAVLMLVQLVPPNIFYRSYSLDGPFDGA